VSVAVHFFCYIGLGIKLMDRISPALHYEDITCRICHLQLYCAAFGVLLMSALLKAVSLDARIRKWYMDGGLVNAKTNSCKL